MKQRSPYSFLMFIIGLFSATQVRLVGSIAISELVIFFIAPFVFLTQYKLFKRDKCITFINLCILSLVGCVLSSRYNHTSMFNFLRGFATPYGFLASFVVLYPMLRKNPKSFGWYLIGSCLSITISTFVFQGSYDQIDAESRGGGLEGMTSGSIFWISRIGPYVSLPARAFYEATPILYSVLAPLAFAVFALFTSASGRSAALVAVAAAAMIFYARKDQLKMIRIRKHIFLFAIVAVFVAFLFKTVYSSLASSGKLGDVAQKKYEMQTKGGKDILHLLMAGRGEFFIGAYYVYHHPIAGYGPWAIDFEGIRNDYVAKFGLDEDYESVLKYEQYYGARYYLVGAHSAMLQFWLAYGILGMPVWLYIFYLIYDYFRRRIGGVPEFFGYFAFALPGALWSIFFTPFGGRVGWGFILAMLLLNRTMTMERECHFHLRKGWL